MDLYLASSSVELVSACIVRRYQPSGPAVLLFNLALNREVEAVRARVLELHGYWDKVVFLEPEDAPRGGDPSLGAMQRVWFELRKSRHVVSNLRELLRQCLGDLSVTLRGRGVRVYFNHSHRHVFYVLGLLPKAERVYYPHGLDQPRSHQLEEAPFMFAPRGLLSALKTWPWQRDVRLSLYVVRFWLGMTRQASLPVPFSGVDRALVFSSALPAVASERIPQTRIQSVLSEIAARQNVSGELAQVFSILNPKHACILLLPELDARHPNRNYLAALEALMGAIIAKLGPGAFLIKPHPRSSFDVFESLLMDLRNRCPDRQIWAWPKAAMTIQTELVVANQPVRCVASVGSCALPPWAAFGVPHFVSRKAAELFDDGWPGTEFIGWLYPSYKVAIEQLSQEGMVEILG